MIISVREIIDVVVMTAAVGFIFMDIAKQVHLFNKGYQFGFNKKAFVFACLVTAPALILHELAHKFVALAYGLTAVFHAAYFWLGFGMVLKMLHSPFLFFVPGYVSITCAQSPCVISSGASALVAFAGPAANLGLFLLSRYQLKKKRLSLKKRIAWFVTKQINLFLFVFNMLPFPLFDGFKVYEGLFVVVKSLF